MLALRITASKDAAYEQNEMSTPRVEPTVYDAILGQIASEGATGDYSAQYPALFHDPRMDLLKSNGEVGWARHREYARKVDAGNLVVGPVPLSKKEREAFYEKENIAPNERRRVEERLKWWKPKAEFSASLGHDLHEWGAVVDAWKELPEVLAVAEEFKAKLEEFNRTHKSKKRSLWVNIKIAHCFGFSNERMTLPPSREMKVWCDWRVHREDGTFSPFAISRTITLPLA